jgi:hypothetical protein
MLRWLVLTDKPLLTRISSTHDPQLASSSTAAYLEPVLYKPHDAGYGRVR